jgi:uncharacterized membrane protein HdeD (DUF308 family)
MKYIMVAMAAVTAITGVVACTDAVSKMAQLYCIGIMLILLGLMTALYIFMEYSRFGEKPAGEEV